MLNSLRYTAVGALSLLVICASLQLALCAPNTTWNFSLGRLDLFNIPALGRSLFGITEGYNEVDSVNVATPVIELDPDIAEDARLTTPQLVKKYGYPSEIHHVVTKDGYILEMHRIANSSGIPVLLTHGLLDSSATWVLMGPNRGLGVSCDMNSPWNFNLSRLELFNFPKFGRGLFDVTEANNEADSVKVAKPVVEPDPNALEDAHLTTPELVKKYGYPAETHHIVTEDGYILEMHRIVNSSGIPVLLTHGLLDSSAAWVLMGPNQGLAYMLYDKGYDVWMMNVRGNTYSRNHTKYSTRHAIFWDFTFHEMGKYDLPASIDHVLNVTGHEKLHYIGHSQGTMTFWIMCSERPEYSDKVILMQALAPVAFVKHCKSPVVDFLAFFQDTLAMLLKLIGAHEFLPSNEFVTMFSQILCTDDTVTKEVCESIIFLITGFDKAQMNETMLPVVIGHSPAGASTKQMQHFGQLKRSGHFRQYDYGWIRNHWRYNSITPPDYKLERVRNKVALHYSQNDWLATLTDVEHLHWLLPNVIGKFLVGYRDFNHLDFVWGVDARDLLYNRVVKLMSLVERGEF